MSTACLPALSACSPARPSADDDDAPRARIHLTVLLCVRALRCLGCTFRLLRPPRPPPSQSLESPHAVTRTDPTRPSPRGAISAHCTRSTAPLRDTWAAGRLHSHRCRRRLHLRAPTAFTSAAQSAPRGRPWVSLRRRQGRGAPRVASSMSATSVRLTSLQR